MSTCNNELYDYELIKKCSKCATTSLKSNFHKDKTKNDGFYNHCRFCVKQKQKQYDIENRDKRRNFYYEKRDKIIKYRNDNKNKLNEYFRKQETQF